MVLARQERSARLSRSPLGTRANSPTGAFRRRLHTPSPSPRDANPTAAPPPRGGVLGGVHFYADGPRPLLRIPRRSMSIYRRAKVGHPVISPTSPPIATAECVHLNKADTLMTLPWSQQQIGNFLVLSNKAPCAWITSNIINFRNHLEHIRRFFRCKPVKPFNLNNWLFRYY